MHMPTLEVILSPALAEQYDMEGKNVVVIDILRATSTIATALAHGANHIVPVTHEEEAMAFKQKGYLVAAERNGKMVDGFDIGNSPFSYMDGAVNGKNIAFTTTNGTKCIQLSKKAENVFAGAFLNINALAEMLMYQERDLLLFCAGWKDKVNLEDTLYAGLLAIKLMDHYTYEFDTTIMAMDLAHYAGEDIYTFLKNSSHFKRLMNLNCKDDIAYCIKQSPITIIPWLNSLGQLVPYTWEKPVVLPENQEDSPI